MIEHADQESLDLLARRHGERLLARGLMLVTAQSSTGGWVAKTVTDCAGSSQWFERGFVTYSNTAKQEMLGVAAGILDAYGAVSEPVVRAMVAGALAHSHAQVAVAISGIAGPGGGTPGKPVGTVWCAWGVPLGGITACGLRFDGDREAVRLAAVRVALAGLLERVPP